MEIEKRDYQLLIKRFASMEQRIKLSVNLSAFDRSLIIADITGYDKKQCLDDMVEARIILLEKSGVIIKKWL